MLTAIDHVILPVPDLEEAIARFSGRLGFFIPPEERGRHPHFGTANANIVFHRGYVELITVVDPSTASMTAFGRAVASSLAAGPGFFDFALAGTDLEADVAALRARGSSASEPERGERRAPDGHVRRWRAAWVRPAEPVPLPFLIQHDPNPRRSAIMQAAAERQPYGVQAVEEITMAVDDLDTALSVYERELGLSASCKERNGARLELPRGRIKLLSRSAAGDDGRVGVYSIGLAVGDLNAAREDLRRRNVGFKRDSEAVVCIDLAETFGARIELIQGHGGD